MIFNRDLDVVSYNSFFGLGYQKPVFRSFAEYVSKSKDYRFVFLSRFEILSFLSKLNLKAQTVRLLQTRDDQANLGFI